MRDTGGHLIILLIIAAAGWTGVRAYRDHKTRAESEQIAHNAYVFCEGVMRGQGADFSCCAKPRYDADGSWVSYDSCDPELWTKAGRYYSKDQDLLLRQLKEAGLR